MVYFGVRKFGLKRTCYGTVVLLCTTKLSGKTFAAAIAASIAAAGISFKKSKVFFDLRYSVALKAQAVEKY